MVAAHPHVGVISVDQTKLSSKAGEEQRLLNESHLLTRHILLILTVNDKSAFAGVPAVAAGEEGGDLGQFRTKLLSFLDISTSYQPAKLISDFPFDGKAFRTFTFYRWEATLDLLTLFLSPRLAGGARVASGSDGQTRAGSFNLRAHPERHPHGRRVRLKIPRPASHTRADL